ncbi:MAG: XdhC family protein [Candidatus Electrothrix scaldis]|nr:MAG: XdhC family protein [Candidatus Electrothrix sp. GW3-3]
MHKKFSWQAIEQQLRAGVPVMLLLVVSSKGSAPGKPGFVMTVSQDKQLQGSIGGGAVEYELVDYAHKRLKTSTDTGDTGEEILPEFIYRTHENSGGEDDSGMVCGGSQQILLYPLYPLAKGHASCLEKVRKNLQKGRYGWLCFSPAGMTLAPWQPEQQGTAATFRFTSPSDWSFALQIGLADTAYLIGGGHVSLAVSSLLKTLGFRVVIFDERQDISTLHANVRADEKITCPFSQVRQHIPKGKQSWVLIMTPSHRYDELVLRQLLKEDLQYLGMLASKTKAAQIFTRLRAEGVQEEFLSRVHAPVGMPIHSRTPEEIAVSIAAEFIQIRNSDSSVSLHHPVG